MSGGKLSYGLIVKGLIGTEESDLLGLHPRPHQGNKFQQ
jgi:hypothetical protein